MLNILAVVLLLSAAALPARWLLVRRDSLGRAHAFPALSTALLLALALAALGPGVLRARLEDRLTDAAGQIVGRPVTVRCQSFGEAFVDPHSELGYVPFDRDGKPMLQTLIKRAQCKDLSAYLRSDRRGPSHDQVVAVHVLTHEAIHMQGVSDEAEAECLAVQHNAQMAEALGAPPDAAFDLSVRYWQIVYPRMPANYRSDRCGPGEALDVGMKHAPWTPSL